MRSGREFAVFFCGSSGWTTDLGLRFAKNLPLVHAMGAASFCYSLIFNDSTFMFDTSSRLEHPQKPSECAPTILPLNPGQPLAVEHTSDSLEQGLE